MMFGGGTGDLKLEEDVDPLEAGIDIVARPPGKRISSLRLLSGGERSLTAISVIFALFKSRPSPFWSLDELDAALDEKNNRRFGRVLKEFAKTSQFLLITHSRISMVEAERLYGVTMEEQGVSCRVVVQIEDADQWGEDPSKAARVSETITSEGGRPLYSELDSAEAGSPADAQESTSEHSDHGLKQA